MSSIAYRPEIDGLRALAILPVVAYHLDLPGMGGGYLGVDVFFVISGYLITSILLKDEAAGTFSLKGFWMRRIRRIVPALAVMVAATLCAAWFMAFRPELPGYGRIALAAVLSAANVVIWRTEGCYWESVAEESPFLHTWSLSLEEQFYLLYPVILIPVLRRWKDRLVPLAAAALAAGLVVFLIGAGADRSACFYLLPTRAWELGAGAFVALLHRREGFRGSAAGARLGLLLVAVSFVAADVKDAAGPWHLAPVLGAALMIANRSAAWRVNRWLSVAPLVGIGKVSYSMYLWHWPVIVLARPYLACSGFWWDLPLVLLATAGLTLASYFLVERPTRRSPKGVAVAVGAAAAAMVAAVVLAAARYPLRHDDSRFATTEYRSAAYDLAPRRPPAVDAAVWDGVRVPPVDRERNLAAMRSGGILAGAGGRCRS